MNIVGIMYDMLLCIFARWHISIICHIYSTYMLVDIIKNMPYIYSNYIFKLTVTYAMDTSFETNEIRALGTDVYPRYIPGICKNLEYVRHIPDVCLTYTGNTIRIPRGSRPDAGHSPPATDPGLSVTDCTAA